MLKHVSPVVAMWLCATTQETLTIWKLYKLLIQFSNIKIDIEKTD
jgi:hypothetical protein